MTAAVPRFMNTYCSQCGADLGPGNEGASNCCDHGACPVVSRGGACDCDRGKTPTQILVAKAHAAGIKNFSVDEGRIRVEGSGFTGHNPNFYYWTLKPEHAPLLPAFERAVQVIYMLEKIQ